MTADSRLAQRPAEQTQAESSVPSSSQGTDPALQVGSDGRTLLQARLARYAVMLLLFGLAYYPAFYWIWSADPGFGSEAALRHLRHWSASSLPLGYALFWLLFRVRVWPRAVLVVLDLFMHFVIGLNYAANILSRPSPLVAAFEGALATMSVLAIRALLVPSPVSRTLLAGLLLCAAPVWMLVTHAGHFASSALGVETLLAVYVTWSVISIVFSAAASSVLYGLRREVQKAQRFGQYTLLEKLGEGGMGVVYRARHAMLRRPTAIKLLNGTKQQSLARFEQEAQLMADLKHPNNVTIHDYGCTADGVFYYAMEYLDGVDLELLVELSGPQPPARVVHILLQVCGALAEAHARDLIHRDIKPGNVFLCRQHGAVDMVKVLDFGVVKDLRQVGQVGATGHQALIGTPHYMSPESVSQPERIDARSDLYSLGAVGYFLLTGTPLFSGGSVFEIGAQQVYATPVPPSQRLKEPLPDDLERVILRCLEKEPAERPESAEALAQALSACEVAGHWDRAQARSWWSEQTDRIEQLRSGREQQVGSIAHRQTVAVARGH